MTKWISFFLLMMVIGCPTFARATANFSAGEMIVYDIEKMKMNIGRAVLEYKGIESIDGKKAELLIFTAKAPGFYDREKIYLDPITYYPIKILRDLDIFGKKEKIVETYVQQEYRVTIVNESAKGKTTVEFKKDAFIDNIYGIIFRYRKQGRFQIKDSIKATLPTKDVLFTIEKEQSIRVNGKKYSVLFMAGEPKNFGFWFSTDNKRIPLKINGALGAISAQMSFKEYKTESK